MTQRIGLDFCCNDPDNGLFAGRVEGIQLYAGGDPVFELEARRSTSPMLRELDSGALRIAGKRWPILGAHDWVGNWCWNRYVFDIEVAADLLIWAAARKLFDLTTGEHQLYQAWRSPDGLASFRPALVRQLAEARP